MPEGEAEEDWPELEWKADRELLSVSGDGLVTPAVNARWIQEAMKKYPYSAQKTTTAVVGSGDKKKEVTVVLNFKMEDRTYRPSAPAAPEATLRAALLRGSPPGGKRRRTYRLPKEASQAYGYRTAREGGSLPAAGVPMPVNGPISTILMRVRDRKARPGSGFPATGPW